MSQGNKEKKDFLILLTIEKDKIKRIDICGVPHWSTAIRTNEYPL